MARIRLENIVKRFGRDVLAVNGLNLEIENGHFAAFLGPSGCGKTTTMNMIAGLETPTEGTIYFNDAPVNHVPPGKRNVGFVFQNYAIFTHMSVYDNLSFGLRVNKMPKAMMDEEVQKVATMLGIEKMLKKRAVSLSVNDMQKVALGRVIVTNPRIFLLDEPFSNLDAAFRAYMRTELKLLQNRIGQTMIYVTHDQIEAMSMADMIAVMDGGKLQQYGTPDDVYNRPANMFVAKFIGSPSMNFLSGEYTVDGGESKLQLENGISIQLDDRARTLAEKSGSPQVTLGIRPEHLVVQQASTTHSPLSFEIELFATEPLGPTTILHGNLNQSEAIQMLVKPAFKTQIGQQYNVTMQPKRVHLFDTNKQTALTA